MKRFVLISTIVFLLTGFSVVVNAQGITLEQSNKSGIYKKNQKIFVFAVTEKQTGDSLRIRILQNNNQLLVRKTIMIDKDSLLIYEGSFGRPCSIIAEARSKSGSSSIGLLVEPVKLKPAAKCPKDFKAYWDDQRKSLTALPLDVKTTPVADTETEKGYSCVNVEINCPGPKPARGYFAKPEIAAPKSLPIVLLVHAAGVRGSWCRSEPKNALNYAKMNTLCFDLNAHGMLNGQPDSYYADLEKGELRNYYLQGLEDRNDFYFRGMYLRLLRTIDFLTRQPEWDGKRILVMGES
jgi:hypothetical protein